MNKLKNAFYIVFAIIFIYLILNIPFREISTIYDINSILIIPIGILLLLGLYFLYKLFDKKFNLLSKKNKKKLILFLFLIIVIVEISVIIVFDVPLGWDFELVYYQAKNYVLDGLLLNKCSVPYYFQHFPNNIPIFLVLIIIFKFSYICGISDFLFIGELFNALVIFLAILFTFLYCRKKFCETKAVFSLIAFLLIIPFFLYIPIFYSDTFSVLFVPLILYLSTFFDDNNKKHRLISYILFGVFSFIGCKMKMTVIFISLGIIFSFLLSTNYKKMCYSILSMALSFLLLGSIYNYFFITKDIFGAKYDNYGSIPYTHWIMMGIEATKNPDHNSYGGYNGDDYIKTESFKTGKESQKYHLKEIRRRISKLGFFGYLNFLTNKAVNAWGDGNFYVAVKLSWAGRYNNNNYQRVISGSDNNHYMIYFNSGLSFVFLILLAFSMIYSFRSHDNSLLSVQLAISMLFVFLLIWENRSRYLYNFIPLYVIIIVSCIDEFKIKKRIIKK